MIKFKDFIIIFIVSYILAEFRTSQGRTEKDIEKIKKDLYELNYTETQRLIENQRALDMLSDINNGLPKKIRRSKYRNYPFNSYKLFWRKYYSMKRRDINKYKKNIGE